jgi:hypothetical protein
MSIYLTSLNRPLPLPRRPRHELSHVLLRD